jgi:phosphatidylglycerol lysyltransferase
MGDPIGNEASFESLLWSFKLEAYKYGCRVAFYEVSDHYLSKYLDMGLILLKMGEEAHIDLTHFTPSGRKKEVVRNARNRIQKMRYQFSVLYPPYDHHVMQRLKNVSDRWLKSMKTGEKAFSMGFFNPDYLKHTPIAVMYDPQGDIVAFANLWIVNEGRKIGIDLMRYESNTPRGMMDALLLETILWAQSEHFEFFSLGMAPLSGLEDHPLAPLWHKMGRLVFDHGNKIYNFEGLHRYKSKFDPIWKPRYVAAPMGLNLPFLFRDIIRLISGVKR